MLKSFSSLRTIIRGIKPNKIKDENNKPANKDNFQQQCNKVVIVDTMRLPHAAFVSCADMSDRKGAIKTILGQLDVFSNVKEFIADRRYKGEKLIKGNLTLLCKCLF